MSMFLKQKGPLSPQSDVTFLSFNQNSRQEGIIDRNALIWSHNRIFIHVFIWYHHIGVAYGAKQALFPPHECLPFFLQLATGGDQEGIQDILGA